MAETFRRINLLKSTCIPHNKLVFLYLTSETYAAIIFFRMTNMTKEKKSKKKKKGILTVVIKTFNLPFFCKHKILFGTFEVAYHN